MRILTKVAFVVLSTCSLALATLAPVASAQWLPEEVIFHTSDPDRVCVGDAATASWSPPADVPRLTGYRVVAMLFTENPPWTFIDELVPLEQTTLNFTAPFGYSSFFIYAVTPEGEGEPFAGGIFFAGKAPATARWNQEGATVGNGTAAVPFIWYGTNELYNNGGLDSTVRVTASPGGARLDIPANSTATFTGLTNGVAYTFSAVTYNACGWSSDTDISPTYVPGIAPTWTRSTPPLEVSRGQYVYKFAAKGDPAPTYELVNAPSWLTISPNGLVKGRPPAGTTSFSYSVLARNGVGIPFFQDLDIVTGPFTVTVRSPGR
ncbi:MAG: hypothetical protein M3198_06520 [Actinomycetota bacterium]|nr:hypothetical protein [Actinomycetota bacterium]